MFDVHRMSMLMMYMMSLVCLIYIMLCFIKWSVLLFGSVKQGVSQHQKYRSTVTQN